jgi:hypothetical protein
MIFCAVDRRRIIRNRDGDICVVLMLNLRINALFLDKIEDVTSS